MDKEYGVTDSGFIMKRLDDIYAEVCTAIKDDIGIDPSENSQSVINTIVTIICDQLAETWEILQAMYLSLFPNTAEGVCLDNIMEIGGVVRIGKAKTVYPISCTGNDGTVLPGGTTIQSTTLPARNLQCKTIASITRSDWSELRIAPVPSVNGETDLSYRIETNATSGKVGELTGAVDVTYHVSVSSYSDCYTKLYQKLSGDAAIAQLGIAVSSESRIVNGREIEEIVLRAEKPSDSFSAVLGPSISVGSVTTCIDFETEEYGDIALANGVITSIVTNVDGLFSVTNAIDRIPGRLAQTDAEARSAYIARIANRGTGTVDNITSILLSDVPGVVSAFGYANDSDTRDEERDMPPHSIRIVVQGGSDGDVADVIFRHKAAGIHTCGSSYSYAVDDNGTKHYVEFDRVENVYLLLSVAITSFDDNLDDDFVSRTKNVLLKSDLKAGTNVRLQSLGTAIMAEIAGADYVELKGLLSTTPYIEDVSDTDMESKLVRVQNIQQPVIVSDGIRVVKA